MFNFNFSIDWACLLKKPRTSVKDSLSTKTSMTAQIIILYSTPEPRWIFAEGRQYQKDGRDKKGEEQKPWWIFAEGVREKAVESRNQWIALREQIYRLLKEKKRQEDSWKPVLNFLTILNYLYYIHTR